MHCATHELNHRLQNSLAVVASMVRLTQADTPEDFRRLLLGRVHALSASQRLLLESDGRGADLAKIIDAELSGFGAGGEQRVHWCGPHVTLDHAAAQGVALALHELATNATKYGALSAPAGRIDIDWSQDEGLLTLVWRETGGPRIDAPPIRSGLGSGVISSAVRDGVGRGGSAFDWRPDGLVCTLKLPVRTEKIG